MASKLVEDATMLSGCATLAYGARCCGDVTMLLRVYHYTEPTSTSNIKCLNSFLRAGKKMKNSRSHRQSHKTRVRFGISTRIADGPQCSSGGAML